MITIPTEPFSLVKYLSRISLVRVVFILLLCAIVVTVRTVYQSLTLSAEEVGTNPTSMIGLVMISLILMLALVALVTNRIIRLWAGLRQGSLGSRLQTRIVTMFCIVTIIPTIIVSVFSAVLFNFGIQAWFNERVSNALSQSVAVAEAYLNEHREIIRADAIAMANDLNRETSQLISNPQNFNQTVQTQIALRSLTEAIVFQGNRIVAQSQFSFSLSFERLPVDVIERASQGDVVLMVADEDKLRALVRLNMPDTYLLIGRLVDSKVLEHMKSATGGAAEYRKLKSNIYKLQIQFSILYVIIALILLLLAIWYGLYFASKLFIPLTQLMNASERIRAGDYTIRVKEGPRDDEMGTLSRAFNRMTGDLEEQRMELIEANRQVDARRRFSEAVLYGVSAGVVATDDKKQLLLVNPTAELLLGLTAKDNKRPILELLPQLQEFFTECEKQKGKLVQGNITIENNDKPRTFHVRINAETVEDAIEGFIVTFDDITELLVAQRNTAWADVARRVAHEIKNPLTPIQLAAERLKKKYLPTEQADAETFNKYIETISKHVGDIGKMVEEFVSFARMPAPEFKREDLSVIIRKIVFSEQVAHPDITYENSLSGAPIWLSCDERQLSQVFINLLKNAAEALEPRMLELKEPFKACITLRSELTDTSCKIIIHDNGPGFPPDKIQKLMEPYFTTRARGTGLGLAIVKKIIEDHKATLTLENHPSGGGCVILNFPIDSGKNVT
jgi:two-component system nitrogen regulation sensor histidine kinase NtrY